MGASAAGLSRSAAARIIRAGKVTLNGLACRPADVVKAGDLVELDLVRSLPVDPDPEAIALDVVFEDDDFLVINKPAGMVVHPASGHHTGTLVHALLGRGGAWSAIGGSARPGIVHRLDKGTSGLIVAARTDFAHRELALQLSSRSLSRTYLAIVRGAISPASGILEGNVGRHPQDRKRMAVVEGGRFARTKYQVQERLPGNTLVRCDLDTGRTHQIRVHFSALGFPISGDVTYGGRQQGADRPMLHAWRLRLVHPTTGKEMEFEASPPRDFAAFWEKLGEA